MIPAYNEEVTIDKVIKEISANKKIDQKEFNDIKDYSKLEKNGKFYKIYNDAVERLWNFNNSLLKLQMGSKAIRYKLYDSS